jgi:diacylglycerol O-acyltransferase
MSGTRMNPLDAVWLMMETNDTPMHVGVLAIFKKPPKAGEKFLSQWAAQWREHRQLTSPWNYRLSDQRGTSINPRFVETTDFEFDYHFRHSALPAPGGERELGLMVSRLHSNALDRFRPLWEFHLIEGLDKERFAFYLKVHHALIDDINGIPMLLSALSSSAKNRDMPPIWAQPLASKAAVDGEKRMGGLGTSTQAINALAKATSGLVRSAFGRNKNGSLLLPRGAPRSTLNRQINTQRRFATQQFQQQRIERLAKDTGSTVNEVLAYLCGSSLRRFFKEYNTLPAKPLIGALPVSLNEQNERLPGNAIAGIRVALGTHIGDPQARLKAIKASMRQVRKDRASLPEEAATAYVLMRAAPIYSSQIPVVGRFVPPVFNLGISNTPGPERPRYFNGARLDAIFPVSQLMQFSALSIDCVSYAGTLNIGFTGARDTLPHLQRLAVYTRRALEDLEELLQTEEGIA